jgi:Na+/H+ antiporter NhaD/arsenite permease-like protein
VFFLAVILAAVFIQHPLGLREALMTAAAAGSWFTTKRTIHEANEFSFAPIREVSWLFAGIFATMVPALDFLQHHADALGIHSPMHFFWASGLLSGVLDNAPTYLAFLATAFGLTGLNLGNTDHMMQFQMNHGSYLMAISLGSVFFGAMTYIGNAPNLMVKAIVEQANVSAPNFFTYVIKYSLPILVPVFALIALLFFWK